jgi:hypothetical protein
MLTDAIIVAAIGSAGISVVTTRITAGHYAGRIGTVSIYASFSLLTAPGAYAIQTNAVATSYIARFIIRLGLIDTFSSVGSLSGLSIRIINAEVTELICTVVEVIAIRIACARYATWDLCASAHVLLTFVIFCAGIAVVTVGIAILVCAAIGGRPVQAHFIFATEILSARILVYAIAIFLTYA